MWVDSGIVAIPLFKIDVPSSSQSIGLGTEFARPKTNNEVEGRKVLGPSSLSMREDFSRGEVLKVSVISDHINSHTGTFEVMSPSLEGIVDSA